VAAPKEMAELNKNISAGERVGFDIVPASDGKAEAILRRP
jgi:hypothetical protein